MENAGKARSLKRQSAQQCVQVTTFDTVAPARSLSRLSWSIGGDASNYAARCVTIVDRDRFGQGFSNSRRRARDLWNESDGGSFHESTKTNRVISVDEAAMCTWLCRAVIARAYPRGIDRSILPITSNDGWTGTLDRCETRVEERDRSSRSWRSLVFRANVISSKRDVFDGSLKSNAANNYWLDGTLRQSFCSV